MREELLQAFWAQQNWTTRELCTTDGRPIIIEFPGWLNQGYGPDFLDARVQIGTQTCQGSIELHLRSEDWYRHQHHKNSVYNSVILHGVLFRNCKQKLILREDQQPVPEIEFASKLGQWNKKQANQTPKELLQEYEQLPGRCGVLIAEQGTESIRKLIGHAAEQRFERKVEQLLARWNTQTPEELLFQLLFKSIGYTAYAQPFEELAQLYPFYRLRPLLRQTQKIPRIAILSRWFGACHLLAKEVLPADPGLRREYSQLCQEWESLVNKPKIANPLPVSRRLLNSPERRLVGLFHHLYQTAQEGLLKTWLGMLQILYKQVTEKFLLKHAKIELHNLFHTPEWELWKGYASFQRPISVAQLVGENRITILWVNAILPFFLAYSRYHQDRSLEQLLYRLFMILPGEAENRHTRFMKHRLFALQSADFRLTTLGISQGMLQISRDFCHNYDQGCLQCELLDLLTSK